MKFALLFAMALPMLAQVYESGVYPRAQALEDGKGFAQVTLPSHLLSDKRSTGLLASQVFAAIGGAADIGSSWNMRELNPVLGRGDFGMRQAAISGAITAGLLLIQQPIVRRRPELRRPFKYMNIVIGSIRFGVAVRNTRIR